MERRVAEARSSIGTARQWQLFVPCRRGLVFHSARNMRCASTCWWKSCGVRVLTLEPDARLRHSTLGPRLGLKLDSILAPAMLPLNARQTFDRPPPGWPGSSGRLAGRVPVQITNPNEFRVRVGLRCQGRGVDFIVPAKGRRSCLCPQRPLRPLFPILQRGWQSLSRRQFRLTQPRSRDSDRPSCGRQLRNPKSQLKPAAKARVKAVFPEPGLCQARRGGLTH